jgi:hypothetical protein
LARVPAEGARSPQCQFRAKILLVVSTDTKTFNPAGQEQGLDKDRHRSFHSGVALDGEIVCLDRNGCPQFDTLFYRRGEPYFYAFDLPYLDGCDLRDVPLMERKRILRGIVPPCDSRLLYVKDFEECGVDLFREVCRRDMEGVVAKWKFGAYISGDVRAGSKSRIRITLRRSADGSGFKVSPKAKSMQHEPYQGLHPEVTCPECGGAGFFGDGPFVESCACCRGIGVLIDDGVKPPQAERKPVAR